MYTIKFNDINKSLDYCLSLLIKHVLTGTLQDCQMIEDAITALREFKIINDALDLYGSSLTSKCILDKKDGCITMEVIDQK